MDGNLNWAPYMSDTAERQVRLTPARKLALALGRNPFLPRAPGPDPYLLAESSSVMLRQFRQAHPSLLSGASHSQVRAMAILLVACRAPIPGVWEEHIHIPDVESVSIDKAVRSLQKARLLVLHPCRDVRRQAYSGRIMQVTEVGLATADWIAACLRVAPLRSNLRRSTTEK